MDKEARLKKLPQSASSVSSRYKDIIGQSEPMQHVFNSISKVAATDANVLITGETGTGKGLVAETIHNKSLRNGKPMIMLNCAAIPATLLESQLFGHCKGAFTDAREEHTGVFEQANGGTLLLDEIGEIPPELQAKLLAAVEGKTITPLCGKEIPVDVRIIAATSRDLIELIKIGLFLKELFYRLKVVEINLPPLRERREDIPLLVKHFFDIYQREYQRSIIMADDAKALLMYYSWPGNVRELQHLLESAIISSEKDVLTASDFEPHLTAELLSDTEELLSLKSAIENYEKEYLLKILKRYNNDKEAASRLLEIDPRTLYRRLKKYKIRCD